MCFPFYRPHSLGKKADNVLGSVCPSADTQGQRSGSRSKIQSKCNNPDRTAVYLQCLAVHTADTFQSMEYICSGGCKYTSNTLHATVCTAFTLWWLHVHCTAAVYLQCTNLHIVTQFCSLPQFDFLSNFLPAVYTLPSAVYALPFAVYPDHTVSISSCGSMFVHCNYTPGL